MHEEEMVPAPEMGKNIVKVVGTITYCVKCGMLYNHKVLRKLKEASDG